MSGIDDQVDAGVDKVIASCLDIQHPRSFFLYAGAGSGKTRSLVEAIRRVLREQGKFLKLTSRTIGVITYTNAACDEITQRLDYDSRVEVSTIHAFAWSLIRGHNADIRRWVTAKLEQDIVDLQAAIAKTRNPASETAIERQRQLENKQRRLQRMPSILKFVYSPTGDNRTRDSLNHTEVIAMTSEFLKSKPALRRMLVSRCPILLIDESQDTNRALMEALLDVEQEFHAVFCLGLFGDLMQRIYADGMEGLGKAIPERWARPRKLMNHRCPVRVVDLINRIRLDDDGEQQRARSDAAAGVVRVFIAPQTVADKSKVERAIGGRMTAVTGDPSWGAGSESIKTLALEHLMSARRFGFDRFFEPLYRDGRMQTSLLQGTGAAIGFFTRAILPLLAALQASDKFAVTAILRESSPWLDRKALEAAGAEQPGRLKAAKQACDGLLAMMTATDIPTARQVLTYVSEAKLFEVPDALAPFVGDAEGPEQSLDDEVNPGESDLSAWREALNAPIDQIKRYDLYVRGLSGFATHQGVKGLEFPRVMVVVSDEEARGFMFAYDKLFGAKAKGRSDLDNEALGKETSIDRTRRLFYVICSRAEESLAIVYYAADVAAAQQAVLERGWFGPQEVEVFQAP